MINWNVVFFLIIAGLGVFALVVIKKDKRAKAQRQQELRKYEAKLNSLMSNVGGSSEGYILREIALMLLRIEQQLKRIQ